MLLNVSNYCTARYSTVNFCYRTYENVTSEWIADAINNEEEINQELVARVRHMMGPIASFRAAAAITALPKTRSGKIIRKSIATLARSKQVKVGERISQIPG